MNPLAEIFELFDTNPLLMTTLNWDKHPAFMSQLRDDKNSEGDGKC